ncbi:MAG: hypothetical protein ACFCVH_11705 [Alphaproteobacteria bacterium]
MAGLRRTAALMIAAASCAAGLGCIPASPVTAAEQPILCESSYSNFAWAPTVIFTGIAGNGQVLHFDSRTADGLQGFSLLGLALPDRPRPADLAHRYVLSSPTGTVVPPEMLNRIAALAREARQGTISREPRGADMGQRTIECYVPTADGRAFHRVVIQSDGDWTMRNAHPAAAELAALLAPMLSAEPAPQ